MELVNSVPITDIKSEMVKLEVGGDYKYLGKTVKFNITDVNLTEKDSNRKPVITKLARKRNISVTISGYIDEPFKIEDNQIKRIFSNSDHIEKDIIDLKGKNMNITYGGVRVIREKTFNETLQAVVNVPRLMIDNTHELYGFLKPIYVNKGEMSVLSEQNIYISFQELVELLKDSTVNLGAVEVTDDFISHYMWITECEKGDTNGD